MKTKILSDFQICISASLSSLHCVKSFQIRTEYGEIQSISPYSVRMRENTDKKLLRIWTLFTQCCVSRLEKPKGNYNDKPN